MDKDYKKYFTNYKFRALDYNDWTEYIVKEYQNLRSKNLEKKIKKQINQAVFYMILNDSTSKKVIDNSENMYKENNFLKLIYHIDSSDGYTEICSQEKIPHTQNRSIIIDNQLNTGEFNPINSRTSLILKLLFKK